jgi:hypothetical protein
MQMAWSLFSIFRELACSLRYAALQSGGNLGLQFCVFPKKFAYFANRAALPTQKKRIFNGLLYQANFRDSCPPKETIWHVLVPASQSPIVRFGVAPGVGAELVGGFDADADAVEFERDGIVRLASLDEDEDGGFAGIVETRRDADAENTGLLHQRRRIFFFDGLGRGELLRRGIRPRGSSGIFYERGGGLLIEHAGLRKRSDGDDARGNSADAARNRLRERLAFAKEKNEGGAVGAVETAGNADGEHRGIRHELRRVLIFDGFGLSEFRGGGRRGGLRGGVERVSAGRSAADNGVARGRTDERGKILRIAGVTEIGKNGGDGRANGLVRRSRVEQRDGLRAGLRNNQRTRIAGRAEGAAVHGNLIVIECGETRAGKTDSVLDGDIEVGRFDGGASESGAAAAFGDGGAVGNERR